MRTSLIAYVSTAIVFFALDFIWLSVAVNGIYRARVGDLLLDKPVLPVAAVFYLVYVVGAVAFAVLPALRADDWTRALWGGALLGLVSYGTYDMTNLSTLKGWSMEVSLIDMAWGTVVTAVASVAGFFITRAV
jgi:uncharacterized membrane protein